MNRELAKQVADAVLYEGYMLYPYRPSALKNRQRWSFGILYPPTYDEVVYGTERAAMHSECIVVPHDDVKVHVQLRFLHLLTRHVLAKTDRGSAPVTSLAIDNQVVDTWDEGEERTVDMQIAPLDAPARHNFHFPATRASEPVLDANGIAVATLERTQHQVNGHIAISCEQLSSGALKFAINVVNETSLPAVVATRDGALLVSMLSAHLILGVERGEFISLLDPPDGFRAPVSACKNVGNFPVLIGNDGERDMMLCSPILLYDYPQVAPESAGDFYDATEMDEMLTLRVMTLTEAEKDEVRRGDLHARNLLERTEQTVREQLKRTHGAIRSFRPAGNGHE